VIEKCQPIEALLGCNGCYNYNKVKKWSKNVPDKDIFALDKVFFMHNVDGNHWTCAIIFMEEKRIQYYDSMGSDGYAYTTGLMRYLKDEWAAKKGGEIPDADKWRIVGAVDGVPQQQKGFDCGVFACMFADLLSLDRPLSFNQHYVTQCRERIAFSILNGAAIE
jgi:sentrin-specific protease 1